MLPSPLVYCRRANYEIRFQVTNLLIYYLFLIVLHNTDIFARVTWLLSYKAVFSPIMLHKLHCYTCYKPCFRPGQPVSWTTRRPRCPPADHRNPL